MSALKDTRGSEVTCDELKTLAQDGCLPAKLSEPAVRAHLAACAECDVLYGAGGGVATALLSERAGGMLAFDLGDLDRLRSEVSARVAAETGGLWNVLRDRSTPVRRFTVLTVVVFVLLGCLIVSPRADLLVYPLDRLVVELLILFTLFGFAVWEATRPLTEPPSRNRMAILALCAGAPLVLAVSTSVLPAKQGSYAFEIESIVRCMSWGTVVAVPVAFVLWLAKRNNTFESPDVAFVGAALGVVGNLLLQIHCPSCELLHLLCAHTPLVLVFALGLGVWRRVAGSDRP
jgi:hypothetical protein